MRRWAHESRYARGSFASDISCLVAAACVSALSFLQCYDTALLCSLSHVCLAVSLQECGRTGAGAAMAEAHCIFEGFGDSHGVWCGEGVVESSNAAVPCLALCPSIVKSRGIGPNRPSRGLTRRFGHRPVA